MKNLNSKDEMFDFFNIENLLLQKEVLKREYEHVFDWSKINYSQIKSFYKQHKELILDYRNDPDSYSDEDQKFLELFAFNCSKNRKVSKDRAYVFLVNSHIKMYFSILSIMYIDGIISYDDFISALEFNGDPRSLVFLIDRECYEDIALVDPSFIPSVIKRFWNMIDFDILDKYILIDYIDLIKELFVENFIPLGSMYDNNSDVYGSKEQKLYNSK